MSRFVQRHRRAASVCVAVLNVRTALAHGGETQHLQQPANFAGFEDRDVSHRQATATLCVPTNSASSFGSPSSSSMATTSRRLAFSSSKDSACECAPGKPGT